jgi:hypothetical protein
MPRRFGSSKAACAPSLSETVTLHRGRGPHHVRQVNVGTQEARPGPLVWSPTGAWREGEPQRPAELRPGVGSTHTTDDAAEGNEVCGRKGST